MQRAIVAPAKPPGPRLCALDTSTFVASLALLQGERIVGELALPTRASHSESLLEALHGLLASCGWTLDSIDAFAVGTGPGSFTGVRIGMATLRALAWTLERPLVGCPTLDLLAMNAVGRTGTVAAVLDARKKEVYFAVYRFTTADGTEPRAPLAPRLPPEVLPPAAALARIGAVAREEGEPLWIVGDGPLSYPEVFHPEALPGLRVGGAVDAQPRAALMGPLALAKLHVRGDTSRPALDVVPLYVRPSEAELAAQRKAGGAR